MGVAKPLVARPLRPFVDLLRVPPRRVITSPSRLAIPLVSTTHRFHSDLPPSRVWTYDGHLPGPTIEVDCGIQVEVQWENRLSGRLPVIDIRSPMHEADGVPVQCMPGRSGGAPNPAAAAISGYAVVHLHGAVTQATSDGWTENLIAPGQQALDTYQNDQPAALLWYHDHVMGITRFNLYAGLAGLWIVREARERELELPEGPPYELPLLLADRNFDTGPDGSLTGELLHKTDPDVMECVSPFQRRRLRPCRRRCSRPRGFVALSGGAALSCRGWASRRAASAGGAGDGPPACGPRRAEGLRGACDRAGGAGEQRSGAVDAD